ncbi:MAG: hypothetical protein KGM42_19475 [Hyphomicrobiales bacterium]|nr:hypothetical protein [Hyphomicrobiales bacterium]
MNRNVSSLILAGALALAGAAAMAQSSTNTMPGGGAKMNGAPSGDAMSDKSSPAMKTRGMAAPNHKAMRKHHVRMHRHKMMKHSAKMAPQKSM